MSAVINTRAQRGPAGTGTSPLATGAATRPLAFGGPGGVALGDFLAEVRGLAALLPDRPFVVNLCEDRSEEHTSELQSLTDISYAVFCLDRKSVV